MLRGFYVNNNLRLLDSLELEYTAVEKIEYSYPVSNKEENNQYRVFLKGFDSDTSDWTNTLREYTNLGENNYEFFIQARDTNGNESEFIHLVFQFFHPGIEQFMHMFHT